MTTPTDLYIDELYVEKIIVPVNNTEGLVNYTDLNAIGSADERVETAGSASGNGIRYGKPANETIGSSLLARQGGYRWIIEIYNGTGSAIELVDQNNNGLYRLNITNSSYDSQTIFIFNLLNNVNTSRTVNLWETTRNTVNGNQGNIIINNSDDVQINPTSLRPELPDQGIIRIGWDDISGIGSFNVDIDQNVTNILLTGDMATGEILETAPDPYSMYIISRFSLEKFNGTNFIAIDNLGELTSVGNILAEDRYYRYSPVNEVIRRTGTGATSSDVCGITRQLASTKPNTTFQIWNMIGVPTNTVGETGDWVYFEGGKLGARGDPHIYTCLNEMYDLDQIGNFRFFDNNSKTNRTFINCSIINPTLHRWKHKKYFNNILISNNKEILIINLGFRGERIEVLYQSSNSNFNIHECIEPFELYTNNYCVRCAYQTNYKNINKIKDHCKTKRHYFKPLVKNSLIIKFSDQIQNYTLSVSNINNFNLQPCRIDLDLSQKKQRLLKLYSGLVISHKYSGSSNIQTLESNNKISETSNKENLAQLIKKFTKKQIMFS